VTVRVRKARRASRLGCGHYVLLGELIANRGEAWICLDCVILSMRRPGDGDGTDGDHPNRPATHP
jgi:hypothetical protein